MTEQLQDNMLPINTVSTPTSDVEAKLRLEGQLKSGASWFYWIAGLSLINSILFISGSEWNFIFGLGVTQLFDYFGNQLAEELGAGAKIGAFALNCVIAAVYFVFGIFSNKRITPVFIVGLVLYALDAGLCLLAQVWLNLAFHAFAAFCIFKGMQAGMQLNKLSAASQQPMTSGH
jgi:hypothetical protein